MKTYDEILDELAQENGFDSFDDALYTHRETQYSQHELIKSIVREAAHRYAQQEAQDFAEWACKRYALTMQGDWMDMHGTEHPRCTTAELYQLYKNKDV